MLSHQDRLQLPHLIRWFLTVAHLPHFQSVLGAVTLGTARGDPADEKLANGPAAKSSAKAKEQKQAGSKLQGQKQKLGMVAAGNKGTAAGKSGAAKAVPAGKHTPPDP